MMTKRVVLATGLTALLGALLYAGQVHATPPTPSGTQTTILAKSALDDLHLRAQVPPPDATPGTGKHDEHGAGWRLRLRTQGLSDAYVVDNKFAVGADTGWHSHPGPSIVFVVAGTMTNYSSDAPGCAPHVYPAGTSFVDPGGADSHLLRNEGTVPAETIAFQLIPANATRRIDEPVPPGCG
jgi:quercetin dioxygenase-like cupin family protein